MNEIQHYMPNMVEAYPLTYLSSKFNPEDDSKLDKEYTDFIDRFESTILVSFGTTFKPKNET